MRQRTPAPSGRLRAADRREGILTAARPLFARGGWRGTGTRELASAAGVTEPILYRHFGDKEGLFLAVLERSTAAIADLVRRRVEGSRGAAGRLTALAAALGDVLEDHLDDLRVLEAAARDLEQRAIADAARAHLTALATLLSESLRGAGLSRGVDPVVAGTLLLEVGLGAAVLWPLAIPQVIGPEFRPNVLALLRRAISR